MRYAARLSALSLPELKVGSTYLRLIVDMQNSLRVERFRYEGSTEDKLEVTVNPNGLEERTKHVIPICAGLIPEVRANLHRVFKETEATRILLELFAATSDLSGYLNAIAESLTQSEWETYCKPKKPSTKPRECSRQWKHRGGHAGARA